MKKLLVIVPGLGPPFLELKFDILRKNLRVLDAGPWTVQASICVYDPSAEIPADLKTDPRLSWKRHTGLLGDHLLACATPAAVSAAGAAEVLVVLDDIELQGPVDWNAALALRAAVGVEILSPVLDSGKTPWAFMRRDRRRPEVVMRVQTACELFCYLMAAPVYPRYHALIDARNPWMWGVDFVLHSSAGLLVGLMNDLRMVHHHQSVTLGKEKEMQMNDYIARHGITFRKMQRGPHVLFYVIRGAGRLARLLRCRAGRWAFGVFFRPPGGAPRRPPLVIPI